MGVLYKKTIKRNNLVPFYVCITTHNIFIYFNE